MREFTKKVNDDDPEITTAQNLKLLDVGLAPIEKIRKKFTDSILEKRHLRQVTFKMTQK